MDISDSPGPPRQILALHDAPTAKKLTITEQPRPINEQVMHIGRDGRALRDDERKDAETVASTVIARTFRISEVAACRLCERCTASVSEIGTTAMCLIKTDRFVAIKDAPLFDDRPRLAGVDWSGRRMQAGA